MKKLITLIICLYAGISAVRAQHYYVQPYYGDNVLRFYPTKTPVGGSPFYTLNVAPDVLNAWGVSTGGPNDVLIYNNKIFVSFDLGNSTGGVLIYNISDIFPAHKGSPAVIKPQVLDGLATVGMAINPANGDLYIGTIFGEANESGVYYYTAASNYTSGAEFASTKSNPQIVGTTCSNLAFDNGGNLWMTTWLPGAGNAQSSWLVCFKGLNSANAYRIENTANPVYTAADVNGDVVNNLNLFSGAEGIAFDPAGNLWLANNNYTIATNGAGQGTLVKFTPSWISALLSNPATGNSNTGPVYTVPTSQADVLYISGGKFGGITFNGNTMYLNDEGQNQGSSYSANGTVWQWDVTTPFNASNFSPSGIYTTYPGNGGGAIFTTPPEISYASPQSYGAGTAITPLAPANFAVAAAAYNNVPAGSGNGFNAPLGVAVDAAGNVYVADNGNNAVKELPAGGGAAITLSPGFSGPIGLAVDAAGNVYVADNGNNAVKEIRAAGGHPVTLASGFSSVTSVAVDGQGNVYANDVTSNTVTEIPVGGGTPFTIGSGINRPYGLTSDAAGNVYVINFGTSAILKIAAGTRATTTVATFSNLLTGITVDVSGNIFVTGTNLTQVIEMPAPVAVGSPQIMIGSGLNLPQGLAVDGAGNVYVADSGNNLIKEISPSGGYYINALPPGLSFSNATGTISGTPTTVSGATNYTVTAYNAGGASSTTVRIAVTPGVDANLAGLSLSNGVLNPSFTAATTSYAATVAYAVTAITVTPVTENTVATVAVNDVAVTSGAASQSIPLIVGANTITTIVTPQQGAAKTYTTTVTRAAANLSTNALITSISLMPVETLVSATGPGYLNFTAAAANITTSIQVVPTAKDANATITVNGTPVKSGSASASIPLKVGANTITTVVTAQDGATTKTVIITVNRAPSTNANLANLTLSSGTLSPAFATATTSYSATVANSVTSLKVTPATADATATVTVNGIAVTPGAVSASIRLTVGKNTITTVVTAQDGKIIKTYTVTVTRTSNDALLTSIKLTPASTLTIVTGTSYVNYTTTVASTTNSVTVTAAEQDATATLTVNGVKTTPGTASAPITLVTGSNVINIVSTAQDGVTTKTYTITATRPLSANANLSALKLSSGALTPVFAAATTYYTAKVTNATRSITVTPTTSDATATVTVNGTAVISGTASAAIPIIVGTNQIATVVTAPNGTITQTYNVTVTRVPSTDALLTSIKLSPASTLTIVTGPSYVNYTTSVPNTTETVTITATEQDLTASLSINGVNATSGTGSSPMQLAVGSNTINIVSTAQDGINTKTYTITATRAAAPEANLNETINVTKPTDNVTFKKDGILVHQGISPNGDGINDYLTIDGITNYPDNNLVIMDRNGVMIYQAKGYDNVLKLFDGHSNINGKMQLPGTYFYALDYTVNGQSVHKTGYIILKY